jgi:FkbH-like protein
MAQESPQESARIGLSTELPAHALSSHGLKIEVASTFTAEPIREPLDFWMQELGFDAIIEFAPYNQVFQELLDPGSLLSRNDHGINIVLLRVEDWLRFDREGADGNGGRAQLERNAHELVGSLRGAASRSSAQFLLAFCPASPSALGNPEQRSRLEAIELQIIAELADLANVCVLKTGDVTSKLTSDYHDARRDEIGHIPYTPLCFAALATELARRIHPLRKPPYKVIALDCDNTLWKGVVGEEGVHGIAITAPFRNLQKFVVDKAANGFLISLCSKNEERDVLEVFDQRPDMVLSREHLVSWRINWAPKSDNLRSLAHELNLGLDSFVFIDDNPVECAEVRANCPEMVTLLLPPDDEIDRFLGNIWALDRLKITTEDTQRTAMYQEEAERRRYMHEAPNFDDFLAGLDLNVVIAEPSHERIARVAQLTQRTNQFNFTTVRRTEGEFRQLSESGKECRFVEVSDRFGAYGLVGVMIYSLASDALQLDSFLLSCRVLGRGVEHRMFNELAEIAREHKRDSIEAKVIFTKKNLPARNFLESIGSEFACPIEGGLFYRIPVDHASRLKPSQAVPHTESGDEDRSTSPSSASSKAIVKVPPYERIASSLSSPEQVLAVLEARAKERRPRPALSEGLAVPGTETEARLAKFWAELLRYEAVGVHDDYFELGGTSLLAVDLFMKIENEFGVRLPLTSIIEAPTVCLMASLLSDRDSRDSLVLIRAGGEMPPLFLVHDGDGETMLYRNLALRLEADRPVYGLQPWSRVNYPILHTRIEEMAAYHISKIQSVQPSGPYFLGGMCAGGVIAFEIALQLQCRGQEVAMVALIDAADVAATLKPLRFARGRLSSFRSGLEEEGQVSLAKRAVRIVGKATRKARNLATYLVNDRIQKVRDEARMRLFRYYLDSGKRLPRLLENIPVRTAYLFAERRYKPGRLFEGELTLFRATTGEGNDEPYVERYSDPLLGWGERATAGVRVYDVPGGHSSMLQEPSVETLATHMQSQLDEAVAGQSVSIA